MIVSFFGRSFCSRGKEPGRGWGDDLQTCDGISVRVSGCVIGDGFCDIVGKHVYREERLAQCGILLVNIIHVIHRLDQGRDVKSVEIEAPDVVEIPFDASEGTSAEPGRVVQVFPGDLGDVLIQGPKIDQGLDKRDTFFRWTNIGETSGNYCLWSKTVNA